MKYLLLLLTSAVACLGQASNTNYGSLQFDTGANVPLSCSTPGFFYSTQLDELYTCVAGQFVGVGGGGGGVASVGLTLPSSIFTVTGSPVTSSGVLAGTFKVQAANTVFAGPTSGGNATPGMRALVSADIPNNAANTSGNATTATALAATPSLCSTGQAPTGVLANGNATGCAAATANVVPPFTWSVTGTFSAVPCTLANCSTGPDSSTAFAAAAAACATAGGGIITVPAGSFQVSQYTWNSGCLLQGAGSSGPGATILNQKANSNEDFAISSGNGYGGSTITETWAAAGSGTSTPTIGGGFEDLVIDGNGVNQSGAGPYRGINAYAVGYTIRNVRVQDTKGPAASFDYNNAQQFQPTGSWNPTIDNFTAAYAGLDINNSATVTFANAACLELGGPADYVATNLIIYDCSGDAIFEGHNVADLYITAHAFSPTLANFWFEGYQPRGHIYVDGAINGQVGVALLNSKANMLIDMAQTTPASTAPGLQIGQASGGTPHCHSFFQTVPGACSGGAKTAAVSAGDVLNITSEGFTSEDIVFTGIEDGNSITIASDHTAGGVIYSGTPDVTDAIFAPQPVGLSCSATIQTCGGVKLPNVAAAILGVTGTGNLVRATSPTLAGSPTTTTQTACDNSTKIATTAYASVVCNAVETSGSPLAATAQSQTIWNNTAGAYVVDLPATASGLQLCVGNYKTVAHAVSFVPPSGSTIYYKGVAGTTSSSTGLVSGGAAGDFICVEAVDSTTWIAVGSGQGTFINN